MPLSIEEITSAVERRPHTIDVPVPELGGEIRLMRVSIGAAIALGRKYQELPKGADGKPTEEANVEFMVAILSHSIVDEQGQRGFLSEEGRDILRRFPPAVLTRLATAAHTLNGMDAEASKEREKN